MVSLKRALDHRIEAVDQHAWLEHLVALAVMDVAGGRRGRLDLHDIGRHDAVEQPGHADPELGGEARQERQIEAAPQQPGERAGQLDAVDVGDRLAHAERGERALRGIGERLELLALDLGDDVAGELLAFAHGELRGLRRVMRRVLAGIVDQRDQRRIAQRPHPIAARHAHEAIGLDAAPLHIEAERRDQRMRAVADGGDDGRGRDEAPVGQLDAPSRSPIWCRRRSTPRCREFASAASRIPRGRPGRSAGCGWHIRSDRSGSRRS